MQHSAYTTYRQKRYPIYASETRSCSVHVNTNLSQNENKRRKIERLQSH